MRKSARFATMTVTLATLFAGAGMLPVAAGAADADTIKMGKEVAYDRKKGNCLACHMMVKDIVAAQLVVGIGYPIKNLVVEFQTFFELCIEYPERDGCLPIFSKDPADNLVQDIAHCNFRLN